WDPWAPPEARPARDQVVADYVAAWLEKQDYSTLHDDKRRVARYLRPAPLGRMPLVEVRPRHVADLLDHLRRLPPARRRQRARRQARGADDAQHLLGGAAGVRARDGRRGLRGLAVRRRGARGPDPRPGRQAAGRAGELEVQPARGRRAPLRPAAARRPPDALR